MVTSPTTCSARSRTRLASRFTSKSGFSYPRRRFPRKPSTSLLSKFSHHSSLRLRSRLFPCWKRSRKSTSLCCRSELRCAASQTTPPRPASISIACTRRTRFRTCPRRRTFTQSLGLNRRCRRLRSISSSTSHPTSCSKMSSAGPSSPTWTTEQQISG